MAYIAPPFTPTVTISGTDLIRNTDEKLQTIANDVGDYLEAQSQAMYTDLDGQMTVIENDYNTVLKPEIEQKMDDLLSVNPDGTYYTKSAIDTLVASRVAKVASTDNAIVRFDGTTGAIQNSVIVVDDYGNETVSGVASVSKSVNELNGNIGITGWALKYTQNVGNGYHSWSTSSNTTAGQAITYVERMCINQYGNVGIGTSSPTKRLEIANKYTFGEPTSNGAAKIGYFTLDSSNYSTIATGASYYGGGNWIPDSTAFSAITLEPSATVFKSNTGLTAGVAFIPIERMRIDSSGNVGIGVTPTTQLEVAIADGASTQGIRIKNLDASMVAGQTVGALEIYSSDPSGAGVGVKGAIRVKSYDSVGSAYDMIFTTSDATTNDKVALTIPNTGGIQLPNTAITGATTLDWYEEATATLTATGMTTSPTVSCKFTRVGNVVTAVMGYLTGTSNATSFTFTGVPTSFRPSTSAYTSPISVKDNGIYSLGLGTLDASGNITLNKDFGGTLFTATGAKGTNTCTFTYTL